MAGEATSVEGEARHVRPLTATMLVVASMIGTGVFTTSGLLIRDLGSPVPVLAAWLLGGVLAACGAVSYGELGAALPRNGGEYQILSRIYHPAVGFAAGLVSLVVGFSAPLAASALAFGHYLSALVPAISPGAAAMVLVVVAAVPHATHAQLGGWLQVAVTLLEIVVVVAFVAAGAARGDPSLLLAGGDRPLAPIGTPTFAVALVYVSFAYSGWNAAVYLAGEVQDPSRTVPRALLLGTSLVAVLYLALNAVFLSAAPPGELAGVVEIGHVAAVRLLGPRAGRGLSAIAALVLAAAVSAMLMAGPRVYERMGLDHPRLALLARRTRRGGPVFAVTLQAVLALAMIATSSFEALLLYIGFTLSLVAGLAVLGVFVLRRREPDLARPARAWGYPATPLVFVVLSAWMIVHAIAEKPASSWAGVATAIAGLALYALLGRPRVAGGIVGARR
jgi:APA family basic amino acid/polyamine antiporter